MWQKGVLALLVAYCSAGIALASAAELAAKNTHTAVVTGTAAIVGRDVLADYHCFVGNRDVLAIDEFSGACARRDVVEVVLMYQALQLGGYRGQVVLAGDDSYKRVLRALETGAAAMVGASVWRTDTHSDLHYVTEPLIREGEFVVGLYTRTENARALSVRQLGDLQGLTAVSAREWRSDWQTLQTLGFKRLYDTALWPAMVKMVASGRADVTLAPFQVGASMALYCGEHKLVPVPNVKVALHGSRHWVVSRRAARAEEIYAALQLGLSKLRDLGRIRKAYYQSGFLNARVDHWRLLNPQAVEFAAQVAAGY